MPGVATHHLRRSSLIVVCIVLPLTCVMLFGGGAGCPLTPVTPAAYNNTTDKTNAGAAYIGSSACGACHADIAATFRIHGHAHKLTPIQGAAPTFPSEGTYAGVPNPPQGFTWNDIAYVIGGYTKKGRFVDHNGYILTTGLLGVPTQWNLTFPPNGTSASWANYEPTATKPKPYDFSCFECHTTGPKRQDEDSPLFQDNRPGLIGTWQEPGITCEACHGPGGGHPSNPAARLMFVDTTGTLTCRECHHRPFNPAADDILAGGGYIQHHEQWPELKASGGHKDFACTECHNPHISAVWDKGNAIRKSCVDCHPNQNMALHKDKVFVRGGYEEPLTCVSCHMPFATKSGSSAVASVVGAKGRMGDTHTHIFRISTSNADFNSFFTADKSKVVRDEQGRAAVTVDFVCLRCHNEAAMPNLAFSVERAAEIAIGVHFPSELQGKYIQERLGTTK